MAKIKVGLKILIMAYRGSQMPNIQYKKYMFSSAVDDFHLFSSAADDFHLFSSSADEFYLHHHPRWNQ